jgi:thiol-disulfide isomerase/thioredoxin
MANIVEVLRRYISPYYRFIVTGVIAILFIIVAYYAYQMYYKPEQNKFSDVANANRRHKDAIIYFFHADWCPHCKKAEPEWATFMSQEDGKEINGYVIKCVDVNCTNDSDPTATKMIKEFGIESYPTVKMVKDDTTIEFDSKITTTALNAFITTVLNN